MIPTRASSILAVLVFGLAGCGKDEPPPAPAEPPKKERKSTVIKVETAVPYGKQVTCEDLIDLEAFAQHTELDLGEVRDRRETNSAATSVCAFMRAGSPPKDNEQLKMWEKQNLRLGVLPGDEYCMLTTSCSVIPPTPEEFEEACRERNNTINEDLGFPACVHQTQRATKWAYTYKVVDPETQCVIDVMGGPSVTDEELVQRCTKAAVALITRASLAKHQ
jgi:hypothetical protein